MASIVTPFHHFFPIFHNTSLSQVLTADPVSAQGAGNSQNGQEERAFALAAPATDTTHDPTQHFPGMKCYSEVIRELAAP